MAAWTVSAALLVLGVVLMATRRPTPKLPPNVGIILIVMAALVAVATAFVRRGNSWAGLVPVGGLIGLAVVWIRASVDAGPIAAVAVLAVVLAVVWLAPKEVRAFYDQADAHTAARRALLTASATESGSTSR